MLRTHYMGQKAENSLSSAHSAGSGNRPGDSGSALIVVLLLVALIVSLVVDFVYEVYIDTSSFSNWRNAQQASLTAKSGQVLSTVFLKEIRQNIFTDEHDLALPVEKYLGPDTGLTVIITDENSKFNINNIILNNGRTNEKELSSLKKLFEYLNINPDLHLKIADWIDPDVEPRLGNSEDAAKNTYLWSVDELKLIEGINKKVFDRISPYITVFGDNLININTAELPVLVCIDENMTEALAKNIIDYREDSPFEHPSHVQRVSGMEAIGISFTGKTSSRSSYFRITATATVNGITRIIESVMDTSATVHFWREG